MEGHISPVSSADEEDEAEIAAILQEELHYDEVDINIHFHCEHCFKLGQCKEWPKPGFSCEIITCPHYCGQRFHACKLSEHRELCSHYRVPCLNVGYGCPHTMPRYAISRHLPQCPASVVVCCCERNRWLAASKLRETVAPHRGHMALFRDADLDVSLALHDQALLNQVSALRPEQARAAAATRRCPLLPLHSPLTGGPRDLSRPDGAGGRCYRSPSLATDEEDLVPGLSGSVCAQLRGRRSHREDVSAANSDSHSTTANTKEDATSPDRVHGPPAPGVLDDYFTHQCAHGVHRSMCRMCKNDAPQPRVQLKSVWREECTTETDGSISSRWVKQQRVAKVRRRGPLDTVMFCRVDDSDEETLTTAEGGDGSTRSLLSSLYAPLTPGDLRLELSFENYSKHQTKPRNMVTVQCLQVVRRDEFPQHYWTVHCGLLGEGLEGRQLLRRCPLYSRGCPHAALHLTAGRQPVRSAITSKSTTDGRASQRTVLLNLDSDAESTYLPSDTREASEEPASAASPPSSSLILPTPLSQCAHSPSPSPSLRPSSPPTREASPCPPVLVRAAPRLTLLPLEVLQLILSYLDGYSLSQLALTCPELSAACAGVVRERGLVLLYWHRVPADPPSSEGVQSTSVVPAEEERGGHAALASKAQGAKKQGEVKRTRWRLGKPWWVFSSSFGSIDSWYPKEGVPSMAEHLKICPYNIRNVQTSKFSYGSAPKRSLGVPTASHS